MSDLRKTEEMVREALEDYRPTPSDDFYERMESVPWARQSRSPQRRWRFLPQLAAALVVFALLAGGTALVSPSARAFVADLFWWHPIGQEVPENDDQRRASATDPLSFAGSYGTQGPAADAAGLTMILDLKTDGSARLLSDYAEKERIVEMGTWKVIAPGRIKVVYTRQAVNGVTRVYDIPQHEVYELHGKVLFAVTLEGGEGSPRPSEPDADAPTDSGVLRLWRR